MYRFVLHKIPV